MLEEKETEEEAEQEEVERQVRESRDRDVGRGRTAEEAEDDKRRPLTGLKMSDCLPNPPSS